MPEAPDKRLRQSSGISFARCELGICRKLRDVLRINGRHLARIPRPASNAACSRPRAQCYEFPDTPGDCARWRPETTLLPERTLRKPRDELLLKEYEEDQDRNERHDCTRAYSAPVNAVRRQ